MKLEGKSVFSGIAIGKCKIFGKKDQVVKRSKVTDTDQAFYPGKGAGKEPVGSPLRKGIKRSGRGKCRHF